MDVIFYSVGIDIGTTTTKIVFSKNSIAEGNGLFDQISPEAISKQVIYRSPMYRTPLSNKFQIVEYELMKLLDQEYKNAGMKKEEIHTGAVIITGESAGKENADKVLKAISSYAGDFVVATAGRQLESTLSGKGSGAWKRSENEEGISVNVDIGGGTSNFSFFQKGDLVGTKCLDIGGALIQYDTKSRELIYFSDILSLEYEKARQKPDIESDLDTGIHQAAQRIELDPGDFLSREKEENIAEYMAYSLLSTLNPEFLDRSAFLSSVSFSGGVGELIYQDLNKKNDYETYGDIGYLLALKLKESFMNKKELHSMNTYLVRPDETICATVIGAACHSFKLSGRTIFYRNITLPVKNKILLTLEKAIDMSGDVLEEEASKLLAQYQDSEGEIDPAFYIHLPSKIDAYYLNKLISALVKIASFVKKEEPFILIMKPDYAKVIGQNLALQDPDKSLICIDGIEADGFDFVDIGCPVGAGEILPVIMKTLLWE